MILKRLYTKNEISRFKGLITFYAEFIAHGIFFRSLVQKREYDVMPYELDEMCAAGYLQRNRFNPIARLLNLRRWKGWHSLIEEDNAASIVVNTLVFPVYFKRFYRESKHLIKADDPISKIMSIGYEPYMNRCGGACEVEKTVMYNESGKVVHKSSCHNSFHYTYHHVIKKELYNERF